MGETMKSNEIRIAPHFLLSEFEDKATGLVRIHPLLPARLEELRAAVGSPLIINSSCRTWPEHERIYRGLYGNRWPSEISLTSRHLITGPTKEALADPILADRIKDLENPTDETYRTCCAADIRRVPHLSPDGLKEAAAPFFDFIKVYDWGVHVDLRQTPLST